MERRSAWERDSGWAQVLANWNLEFTKETKEEEHDPKIIQNDPKTIRKFSKNRPKAIKIRLEAIPHAETECEKHLKANKKCHMATYNAS